MKGGFQENWPLSDIAVTALARFIIIHEPEMKFVARIIRLEMRTHGPDTEH